MDPTGSANPQLLEWVKEWLNFAREKNTKGFTTYKKAYDSLKACPITFQHPAELQQLKGFGPKLCDRLAEKLRNHCLENGLPMPEHPHASRNARTQAATEGQDESGQGPSTKKTRKPKAYAPALRSGAYALIVALSSQPPNASKEMTKTELIELAQPHCDSSFSAPSDPTKFYTAWSSMKTLITKELVYERGRPLRKYGLTDEGWEVANRVNKANASTIESASANPRSRTSTDLIPNDVNNNFGEEDALANFEPETQAQTFPIPQQNGVIADDPSSGSSDSLPTVTPIQLPPGSFTVQFILDVREVRSKTDRDYMRDELAKQGVKVVMRSLELGDAQWIAKVKDPELLALHGAEGDEIVLDWIVERKRLDDLIGSIKDGRFHEQKFRLKRSGVQKVIYLIEDISIDQAGYQRYEEAVQSAIASTQVVNGYFVKRTTKMDETIRYLARMTKLIQKSYEVKTLNVIPTKVLTAQNYLPLLDKLRATQPDQNHYVTYAAFSSLASKSETMTLGDVFLKMLMTTRGVTGERAIEIQRRWKTPFGLVKAYQACGSDESGLKRKRDLVFNETTILVGRKKISKQLSQKIYEVWGATSA